MRRARARAPLVVLASAWIAGAAAVVPGVALPQTRPAAARPAAASKPLAQALTGQAKADYDAGKTLAGDGDFPGALIKFQSAYYQSRDPRLLWNIAFCEKNLRHYAKVISTLQRYLAEGAGYLTDKDRKDAQDLINTLQPFTTNATIKVSQDGAQVFVDDAPVGTSPLPGPVVLDIGERHVRVTKDGFKPWEKTIPVGGTASVSVDVNLEQEVHEGRLVVNAPPDATLTLDDKPVGTGGKVDMNVAAGGHQLRATASGMRPYQSEVVVQDKETRQVDVMLEKELPPEKPKLRVAIGCDGPEPLGPDDGLVMYLDGPEVVAPVNVKKRWDEKESRNVVEYVEYAVDAGQHTVRARIPDCEPAETRVQVDAQTGGAVTGALDSDTPLLFRGPQGAPGHWRIGAGLWMFEPATGQYMTHKMVEAYQGGFGSATGFVLEGALLTRWFGMFLAFADGYGSMSRATFNTNTALPATTSTQVWESRLRMAFRIPFNVVSLNLIGPQVGLGQINLQNVSSGQMNASVAAWSGIDIQPFCDFGANVSADVGGVTDTNGTGPAVGLQFGLYWEPNARCRRERSTAFGLRAGEAGK
jgi:hypothetical protein